MALELGEDGEFPDLMKPRSEFEAGGTGLFGEGSARAEFVEGGESLEVVKRSDPWNVPGVDFSDQLRHFRDARGFDVD